MTDVKFVNLKSRVVTASVLGLVVLVLGVMAGLTWVGRLLLFLLLLAGNLAAAWEFSAFCSERQRPDRCRQAAYLLTAAFPSVLSALFLARGGFALEPVSAKLALLWSAAGGAVAFMLAALTIFFVGRKDLGQAQQAVGDLLPAVFLLGLGGASLLFFPLIENSVRWFFWLLLVVCANDISAYFGGSRIGGPKLAPAISPKKTVSGSICGLAGGLAAGYLAALLLRISASDLFVLSVSFLAVIAAQLGDALKSVIKRAHGVDDSGSLLPGHGGVLDRIDGLLSGALLCLVFLAMRWSC